MSPRGGTLLSARALNRATLARQLLLRREPLTVTDGVRRVLAIQAQAAPSPYLALWSRLTEVDPADVDAAFASHAVVKATLMRITLHAVHADDYPLLHRAMQPTLRAARLGDARFTGAGLTAQAADAVVPRLRPAPPRLLPMWDSVLLAYADRSRVLPEEYRPLVIRRNGDTLPTVLVDGHVAGVWRPADGGGIEVTAFRALGAHDWAGLAEEAAGLAVLLAARDPVVYGSYRRWWDTLPAAQVRVLGR